MGSWGFEDLGAGTWVLGDLETWVLGDLETWGRGLGFLGIWRLGGGDLGSWGFEDLGAGTWVLGDLKTWGRGLGFLGIWGRGLGFLEIWWRGFVDLGAEIGEKENVGLLLKYKRGGQRSGAYN